MGPTDENPEYAGECRRQIRDLKIADIEMTGKIKVKEYLGKMDFLVLSSLSEGQPLVILEGYAAKKPVISTNVGNCRGMIYGVDETDNLGKAGVIVPILGVNQMAQAMLQLAEDEELRKQMGESGYQRAIKYFDGRTIFDRYKELYKI